MNAGVLRRDVITQFDGPQGQPASELYFHLPDSKKAWKNVHATIEP